MDSNNKIEKLKETILNRAGSTVNGISDDTLIDMWTDRGEFMNGENSIIEDAPLGMCHNNSLDFYLNNENIRICTGFAINLKHGVWVRHSWCIDKEGIVHECTPLKRDIYFGTILDEKEAEQFRREFDYEYAEQVSRKTITPSEAAKNALKSGTTMDIVSQAHYIEDSMLNPEKNNEDITKN